MENCNKTYLINEVQLIRGKHKLIARHDTRLVKRELVASVFLCILIPSDLGIRHVLKTATRIRMAIFSKRHGVMQPIRRELVLIAYLVVQQPIARRNLAAGTKLNLVLDTHLPHRSSIKVLFTDSQVARQ